MFQSHMESVSASFPPLVINKRAFLEAYQSCEMTSEEDTKKALKKIQECLNPGENPSTVLNAVKRKLMESRLTVNFDLTKSFYPRMLMTSTNEDELLKILTSLSNTFSHTHERKDRPPDYKMHRNQIECDFFPVYKLFPQPGTQLFHASSRPIYGACDFWKGRFGGASMFGRSYFILKPYLKQIATFLSRDSVFLREMISAESAPNFVDTIFHLNRVIAYAPEDSPIFNWLHALIANIQNGSPQVSADLMSRYGSSAETYVEFQIHGEVRFDRDIEAIILSEHELRWLFMKQHSREEVENKMQDIKNQILIYEQERKKLGRVAPYIGFL